MRVGCNKKKPSPLRKSNVPPRLPPPQRAPRRHPIIHALIGALATYKSRTTLISTLIPASRQGSADMTIRFRF